MRREGWGVRDEVWRQVGADIRSPHRTLTVDGVAQVRDFHSAEVGIQ